VLQRAVYEAPSPESQIVSQVAHMRARLEKEIAGETAAKYNLKTGFGGLVDIEFLVQLLQLVHGRENPWLRVGNTLTGVRRLTAAKLIPLEDGRFLDSAYRFLRHLENRLRIVREQPVSELPRDPETAGRLALRAGLGQGKDRREAGVELLSNYVSMTKRVRAIFERYAHTAQ
jgi:glutamate-ammonia-ligase adenylyltransferase